MTPSQPTPDTLLGAPYDPQAPVGHGLLTRDAYEALPQARLGPGGGDGA